MDLSKWDPAKQADTAVMPLLDPLRSREMYDEDKMEAAQEIINPEEREKAIAAARLEIDLIGIEAPEVEALQQKRSTARLNRKLGKGRIELEAGELQDDSIEQMVACIKGWRNIIVDGKEQEYSSRAATVLLNRFGWIRDQVDRFINTRAHFLGE